MADRTNPFTGRPGFWNRVNRALYPIAGPAQVGIGHGRVEAPYTPPENPICPICAKPMAEHVIRRGGASTPTVLTCPA